MDFRNKWAVRVVRILFGLFFLFSGVSGFMAANSGWQGVPPESVGYTQMLWDTGLFQLIKGAEVICGLMLVVGFLPWLAAIPLAPIAVGAEVVTIRTLPAFWFLPLTCILALLYLAYAYWPKYQALFTRT